MPNPSAPATVPFDLDGMADLARQVSPEIAQQVNSEVGAPPATETPEVETETPAGETEKPEVEAPETEKPETPEAETTVSDELEELNRQSAEAAKKKADAEKAAKAPPPEVVKKPEPSPTDERDKDLKLDERAATTLHPKTKKLIEERNQKIIVERNRATTLEKEKTELAAKLAKAEEDAKKIVVPKQVEEELKTLRERVRELDITKDPALEAKYDAPVRENQEKVITLLKNFGLGTTVDGKPDPAAIEALKKSGMTFAALAPHIKKLSEAGEEGAAEELREILRDSIRLGRAKEKEITEWRSDFDSKRQQQTQQSQQQQEKMIGGIREHANRILAEDLKTLTKDFPFLERPADPLSTDSPVVAKAKQDAIAAYEQATKSVAQAVEGLDATKVTPDKVQEVHGRMSASAIKGIILQQHVLPKVLKDLAELRARNTELESKVGKIKAAGTLSRAHAAAASAPAGAKTALPENMEDAAKQIAKEMGVSIE